jgi:hypothetical protein
MAYLQIYFIFCNSNLFFFIEQLSLQWLQPNSKHFRWVYNRNFIIIQSMVSSFLQMMLTIVLLWGFLIL